MERPPAPALRGAHLYFDCASGIAGDMTVGALVDLGVPPSVVEQALAALPMGGYRIRFDRVLRGGLAGTKFRVLIDEGRAHGIGADAAHQHDPHEHEHAHGDKHAHEDEHEHTHGHAHEHGQQHTDGDAHAHTHYREIRKILASAGLGDGVRERTLGMFNRVAEVEARLHGVAIEEVAFHEVGAVDSIVDIVSVAAALDWLAPARVTSRPVPLGRGRVRTAHGLLPLPAPATLELLRGASVEDGGLDGELTTPTGAAVLAACVAEYGALPPMRVIATGWGAGDKDFADRPNLLRVIAGAPIAAPRAAQDRMEVVAANIDDMTPELLAPLLDALLGAGAADAWLTPVIMKKGRPGFVVAALCGEAVRATVEATLLRESSTIGLRRHTVERTTLPRRIVEVDTPFGPVPLKIAGTRDEDANAAPEFEACRRIAAAAGVPIKRVHAEAIAAWYRRPR